MHNNLFVVDEDRIRLITPTHQAGIYLKALLGVAAAFGLKLRDGDERQPTKTITGCIEALKTFSALLDRVHTEASKRTGRKSTDGTHGSIAVETRTTLHRIIRGLQVLQHNLHGLMDEADVLVRSLVTDVNEHFHADMRQRFRTGMMTPLQFQGKLFQVIDATVRQQYYPGFHIPHKKYTLYQKPTPTNEPNCPARIVVKKPPGIHPLTLEDRSLITHVVGTKEVLQTVAPRKLTCKAKATFEAAAWLRDSETTAEAVRAKRAAMDDDPNSEKFQFSYGDIVLVDVSALPIGVRHTPARVCYCVIREDVVRLEHCD